MTSYLRYKKELSVVQDADDIESWITVRGNHIPIRKGQSKEDAVKSFLESKGSEEKTVQSAMGYGWTGVKLEGKYHQYRNKEAALKFIEEAKKHGYKESDMELIGFKEEKVDNRSNSGKVYTKTMSKIRNFKAKEDGTYDFETGKPKDYPDGYSVSFHQNEPDAKGNWKSDYGRYSDEDYDKNVSDMVKETGGELNIGYFAGTPEVSVWVKDFKIAVKMAKKHNQHSVWDWKAGDVWINPDYDPKKNPMKQ